MRFTGLRKGCRDSGRSAHSGERTSGKRRRRLAFEALEGRQLLAASLAPIGAVTVPTTLGFQVPLNGSGGGATSQTFSVTSSNPDIKATVAQGQFLTLNLSHAAASGGDVTFSGPLTFQLFDDLTPLTTSRIEQFTTSGFYNGKTLHRVAAGFPTATTFIIQGGSASGNGSGSSGQPGTPFVDEFVQQLAFTGSLQLAMANSGPDTNDTQFFITTGSPRFLDFKHTVFAQLVADPNSIVPPMTAVARTNDAPISPIRIDSASLSTTNPNGVIHVDATHANPGETSTINVTAFDPATNTTATQSFAVSVGPNTQNERAFIQQLPYPTQVVTTTPGTTTQPAVVYVQNVAVDQKDIFRIPAVDPEGDKLTYTVQGGVTTNLFTGAQTFTAIPSDQATATVDQNTGVVTVTPASGFTGQINLLVGVRDQTQRVPGSTSDDPGNFSYHRIILNVSGTTPVAQTPIALPVSQAVVSSTPVTIQLQGRSANPGTSTGLTYALVSQPANGTVTGFDPSTGTLVYTATANFHGNDSFQYTVTDGGTGGTNLTSPPATVTVTVGQAATSTTVVVSPATSVAHQTVTLTATVSVSGSGAGTPTGTVQFFDGSSSLGTGTLNGGTTSLALATFPVGSHSITARYQGDANFAASTSTAAAATVAKASTATTLTASPASPVSGQAVTLTATVAVASPATGTPTGTVEFLNGATSLGVVPLANGVATLAVSLPVGSSAITARYSGDVNNLFSNSAATSVVVAKASTATNLVVSPATSVSGQAVTLSATVSRSGGGSGTPTGTVAFSDGSVSLGVATLANGIATLSVPLAAGAHAITAQYQGDANFQPSSAAAAPTVARASTTTTLALTSDQPGEGRPATLTATVSTVSPGSGTPTGRVRFIANGVVAGEASLVDGVASLEVTPPSSGAYQVAAFYLGDAEHRASLSATAGATVGDATQPYLNGVFLALLGRPITPQGLDYWGGLLAGGRSRQFVARAIARGVEARGVWVRDLYQAYMDREATDAEVAGTLAKARAMHTSPVAVVLGSRDYFENQGGGTIRGYLDAIAGDVLGRPFSAAADARLAARLSGGTSPVKVAESVLMSRPGRAALVGSAYTRYLGRSATAQEVADGAARLGRGGRFRTFVASLLAGDESSEPAVSGG